MPGEISMNGQFDVTKLEAWEIETATQEVFQSNIIDWGETFFLKVYFQGSGPAWTNMCQNQFQYKVKFYAEGMGPGVPDQNFGEVTGNLVPNQDAYVVDSGNQAVNANGVFRCGVMVTFSTQNGGGWWGVLGYNEDCVIQVHEREEFG
jgi:hypothetical protein